jgi:rhodanese-related sulfurtransferase
MKTISICFALGLLLYSPGAALAGYTNITATAAYAMLQPGNATYHDHTYLLDIRTPSEWRSGHPGKNALTGEGAFLDSEVFNIDFYDDLFLKAVECHFDQDDYLLIMCGIGGRSASACRMLAPEFSHVYNVLHGFSGSGGWKSIGLPYNNSPVGMWDGKVCIPIPPSFLLMGSGLVLVGLRRRSKVRQ